jgi:hypothetical protein
MIIFLPLRQEGVLAKVRAGVQRPVKQHVTSVLISGDWAIVELAADAVAKAGWTFDNKLCWVCRFDKVRWRRPAAG